MTHRENLGRAVNLSRASTSFGMKSESFCSDRASYLSLSTSKWRYLKNSLAEIRVNGKLNEQESETGGNSRCIGSPRPERDETLNLKFGNLSGYINLINPFAGKLKLKRIREKEFKYVLGIIVNWKEVNPRRGKHSRTFFEKFPSFRRFVLRWKTLGVPVRAIWRFSKLEKCDFWFSMRDPLSSLSYVNQRSSRKLVS